MAVLPVTRSGTVLVIRGWDPLLAVVIVRGIIWTAAVVSPDRTCIAPLLLPATVETELVAVAETAAWAVPGFAPVAKLL